MESEGIFWGIILKPEKRYESVVEEDFRVTKACVDTTTLESGKVATVILEKGNEEFILCNLTGPSNYDSNMDLAFVAGEKICFKTEGSATVHLTGSLMPDEDMQPDDSMMMGDVDSSMFDTTAGSEDEEGEEEEEESDSDDEAPKLVAATNGKRKLPEAQNGAPSPKQSAKKAKKEEAEGKTEEVKQAEAMKKVLSKDKKKGEEVESEDGDETMDADMDDLEEEEDSDDEDGEEEEESDEDGEEEEEETPTPKKKKEETPKKDKKKTPKKPEANGDAKNGAQADTPAKKADKKVDTPAKPVKEEQALTPKGAKIEETPKSKKKDKKNKNKAEGTPAAAAKPDKPASPTKTPKPLKMTLKGGIVAEDIRVGNGPEAKAGKHVGMYYKGTLTKSGKQFDACQVGKPFKFKLGKGEVIKGWDVGVEGMKVGGKRKLTIPPHMAYGKDGAGGDIPPNASLTFEVECKTVN